MPRRPTVAITVDGGDPRYLDDALSRGLMPRLREMLRGGGSYHLGRGQMPSFTNTNNVSIVTGAPPVSHGLPGNHYRSPTGEEVQLTDPEHLRAPTIHAVMGRTGATTLCVTAKDKLRRLLGAGGAPAIIAERAHEHSLPAYGIEDVVALLGRPNPGP
ncbi:MAG: alkaline phosphatase family protein, partial [Dehalococcoidia bacterium]